MGMNEQTAGSGTSRELLLREYFLNASLLANLKQAGEEVRRTIENRGLNVNFVLVRSES